MKRLNQFSEKFQLARQTAQKDTPTGGLCGFELEWNLLDSNFCPLEMVSTKPGQISFVDFLRTECIPQPFQVFSQLEVFHWMVEWATRPFYTPRAAVYEARLFEAILINALHRAGRSLNDRLYYWHGNLLALPQVGPKTIPGSWHIAKRRYLERCVNLYGSALATAGIHTNLSLPEPLLAWDFMHLSPAERGSMHLDEYKSEFYIQATRLMRAFTAMFIAISASTPFEARMKGNHVVIAITERDSVRNLTFPNPATLDLPNLYRSYDDYLQTSYELVRSGVRFGNNNWMPVRARSFAEPVERLIAVTSEQLSDLYARGFYGIGNGQSVDEMAKQIEMQNLMARINLPMNRVEVRTDDGCQALSLDIANLTFKHLLMALFYADAEFARAFRYDREDLERARRNEETAAMHGLHAEIENPFTGKRVSMRQFLAWTLDEVKPVAEALDYWEDLQPLVEISRGAANTAEKLRDRALKETGGKEIVPVDFMLHLVAEREEQVQNDVATIIKDCCQLGEDAVRLDEFLEQARRGADPDATIHFHSHPALDLSIVYADKTSEILALAQHLVGIPSVTACLNERLNEVREAAYFIDGYLRQAGLSVQCYDNEKYPAVLATFPGQKPGRIALSGHFDVVAPDPDESQFEPRLEGDYLWGRGAADMKTVVATYLVWMKDACRSGGPFPDISLLLVGNEENGEFEPVGTPHVLQARSWAPELMIAGERTGERGSELWGEICPKNRGVMRLEVIARGQRGHSGVVGAQKDLIEKVMEAKVSVAELCARYLTLKSSDGWQSQVRFPFIQVGEQGVYNITPDRAILGAEIRPIPEDNIGDLLTDLENYCNVQGLEFQIVVKENGIACDPANPALLALIQAVRECSGEEPRIGRKLPATSARFAPRGQGVVWGQTGIGPHARDERHYIPSILPYYRALQRYGELLSGV